MSRSTGFQPVGPAAFQAAGSADLVQRQGARLPHWTQEGGTYFVTYRLADAVPLSVLEEWRVELASLENLQKASRLDAKEAFQLRKLHSESVQSFLDAGHGACVLRNPGVACIVRDAMHFFNRQRYELSVWCVMPNHVHVVFRPLTGWSLDKIMHSWKSFTSNKINELLGRSGQLWQIESFDHLVRDQEDYIRCAQYTLANPTKAGLVDWPWVWSAAETHRQDADGTHGQDARATP